MVTILRPGLAYGVFRCSDARPNSVVLARFKEALENIKAAHEETKIPPRTEFSVFDIRDGIAFAVIMDEADGLVADALAMKKRGANFMIRSSLPDAHNVIAARDLGDTLNMLYGATELFAAENEGREKLVMDVFYADDRDVYVSVLAAQISGK